MEVTPTTTPASPAAGVTATSTTPAPATQAAPVNADPFAADNIQKRIDSYLADKKAATAPAAAAAAATTTEAKPAEAKPADAAPATTEAKPDAAATEAKPADAATTEAKPADAAATTDETKPAAETAPDLSLVVELPSRNPNGEPLRIAAPDKATAEALARLKNGYLRGEDARTAAARVEEREERVQEMEIAFATDPLSVMERIPTEQRIATARALLAENFDALRNDIADWWEDDSKRRLARAETLEQRDKARGQYQERLAVQQEVKAIRVAVTTLIPEGADPAEAQEFYTDSLRYLASVADARPNGKIADKEVATLLANRLRRYGFDKPAATSPAAVRTVTAASPAPASQTSVPTVTAEKAQALAASRAAAAASTTPGAGATPVTALPKPPKGSTIEQVADFYMNHFKNKAQ